MGDFTKWHGLKPALYRVKTELFPGLTVDFDEMPASGEIRFRFGGKAERHPIEAGELRLGRYAIEIIQDSFLAKLNQFTLAVTPNACADVDFAKLKSPTQGAPNYCTPWMHEDDLGIRIAGPARVETGVRSVVLTMMCQFKDGPNLPPLPDSPTLIFVNLASGAVLRRTVAELEEGYLEKEGKAAKEKAPAPPTQNEKGATTEFFNIDVGYLLKPGTYRIVAHYGIFESNAFTVTVGHHEAVTAPEPFEFQVTGDAAATRLDTGPFRMTVRHKTDGPVIKYGVGTKPRAKVDMLDATALGLTPVHFTFGRRITLRLIDKSKTRRQMVTIVVKEQEEAESGGSEVTVVGPMPTS